MKKVILLALLVLLVLTTGCKKIPQVEGDMPATTSKASEEQVTTGRAIALRETSKTHVVAECTKLCKIAKERGVNLTSGPCLSDKTTFVDDWVCDVAHNPRQPVDRMKQNQCKAFLDGKAHHFVEVDENCEFFNRR